MNDFGFWHKQTPGKPLFPDIVWQRPEQKALAGKLLIIGGNAHGFAAVAQAYQEARKSGVGKCRVVLPDALKNSVDHQIEDVVFVRTNQSGGVSREGMDQLKAAAAWADGILFIGDAGRNSETAIVYEELLHIFSQKLIFITRDGVDLVKSDWPELLENPTTTFVVTLAQLQKICQSVYYPKTILFSMQLTNLVDALHKFTITYPACIVVFHQQQLIVAKDGHVSTTPWTEPLLIWRGSVATKAAVDGIQQPTKLFEAITTSVVV